MTKEKRTKGQTMIYKTLHRKLRCSRRVVVPAQHVTPVMVLLNETSIITTWKSCWTPVQVNKYK